MSRLVRCALTGLVGLGIVLCPAPAGGGGDVSAVPLPALVPPPTMDDPPSPVISSGGRRITGLLGAFCYKGACADMPSDWHRHAPRLAVRRGALVTIRFSIPTRTAALGLNGCSLGVEQDCGEYARLRRRDPGGRLWTFRVPSTPIRPTDLVIFVRFPRGTPGSAEFGFKVVAPARR